MPLEENDPASTIQGAAFPRQSISLGETAFATGGVTLVALGIDADALDGAQLAQLLLHVLPQVLPQVDLLRWKAGTVKNPWRGGRCHTACLAQCHVNAHAPAESSTRKELRHLIEKQKKNSQRGTHSARPPGGRGVASPFALEGGNTKLLCSFSHLRFCWERSALSLLAILLLRSQFDDPWGAQFLKSTCR